jgi:hypothetical protein
MSEENEMRHSDTDQALSATMTIRRLDEADRGKVRLLAQLDSSPVPDGPLLGAEVEGRLLAATSVTTGETVADPFSRTAEVRALLELRSAQLRRRSRRRRGFTIPAAAQPARASLAGSPPGVGGRPLTLLPRP